jgi:putative membrane protein insertion efficiency factor
LFVVFNLLFSNTSYLRAKDKSIVRNYRLDRGLCDKSEADSIAGRYCRKFIRFYQRHGSKFLGSKCGFSPTCSPYGIGAFEKYGTLKAMLLTINRLQRCHPWNKGYYIKRFVDKRWINYDIVD